MPIACVYIPRFAVEAERQRRRDLTTRLILVGDATVFDCCLGRRLRDLGKLDILVLDELGYLPMDAQRASLFFQLVSHRYERGSIVVTTNKPFDQWGQVFGGDDVMAAASSTASSTTATSSPPTAPATG